MPKGVLTGSPRTRFPASASSLPWSWFASPPGRLYMRLSSLPSLSESISWLKISRPSRTSLPCPERTASEGFPGPPARSDHHGLRALWPTSTAGPLNAIRPATILFFWVRFTRSELPKALRCSTLPVVTVPSQSRDRKGAVDRASAFPALFSIGPAPPPIAKRSRRDIASPHALAPR